MQYTKKQIRMIDATAAMAFLFSKYVNSKELCELSRNVKITSRIPFYASYLFVNFQVSSLVNGIIQYYFSGHIPDGSTYYNSYQNIIKNKLPLSCKLLYSRFRTASCMYQYLIQETNTFGAGLYFLEQLKVPEYAFEDGLLDQAEEAIESILGVILIDFKSIMVHYALNRD